MWVTIESSQLFGPCDHKPPDVERLDVFFGNWINEGATVEGAGILTTHVYQWMAEGHFVLRTAYGRIGDLDVGGTEILGWDPAAGRRFLACYDASGGLHQAPLGADGASWKSGASTGCTAKFSPDGRVQTGHHVRLDGDRWVPSMEVVLRKVIEERGESRR